MVVDLSLVHLAPGEDQRLISSLVSAGAIVREKRVLFSVCLTKIQGISSLLC